MTIFLFCSYPSDEGCIFGFVDIGWRSVFEAFMPPAYDLILLDKGQCQIETVEVKDAVDAWRHGRERYPRTIRAVVCKDASAAQIVNSR